MIMYTAKTATEQRRVEVNRRKDDMYQLLMTMQPRIRKASNLYTVTECVQVNFCRLSLNS